MKVPNFDFRMKTTILSIFFCMFMVANGNLFATQASAGSRRHFMILQPLRLITSVSASGASRHISSSGLGGTVNGNYPLLPMVDIRNNHFRSTDVLSAPVTGSHMTNGHVKSIQHNKSLTNVDNSSNAVNKGSQVFTDSRWSTENNSSRNVKQTVIIANTANIITQHPGDNNVMPSRQSPSSVVINNNNVHGNGVMNNNRAHGGSSIVNDIRNNIRPLQRILPENSSKTHTLSDALPSPLARSQPVQTIHISSASSSANVITNTGPESPNLQIHGQEGTRRQMNSDQSHQRHTSRSDPTVEQNATLLAVAITKAILQYPETRTMLGQPRTNINRIQSLLSSLFTEAQVHNNLSSASAESSILLQNTLPVASTAQSASSNTSFIDSFTPHTSLSPWEPPQNQNIPHGQHPHDARNDQRGPVGTEPTLPHSVPRWPIHSINQNGQVNMTDSLPTTNAISNNGNINVMARLPSNTGTFGIPTFNGHGTVGSQHSNIVHSHTNIDIRPSIHINPASNSGFRPITTAPSWIIGGPYKSVTQDRNSSIHSNISSSNFISGPPATNSPLHRQGNQGTSSPMHLHPHAHLKNLHNQSIDLYGTAIKSILSLLNILGNTTLHRSPTQTQPFLPIGHLPGTSAQGQMTFFGGAHGHGSTAGPLTHPHNDSGGHQPVGPLNHGRSNSNGNQQGNLTGLRDPVLSQSSANQPFGKLNHGHINSNGNQQSNPAWPHDPVHSHSSVNLPSGPLNHGNSNSNGHQQGNSIMPRDPVHSHSSANQSSGKHNHGHSNSNGHQQGNPSGLHDPVHNYSSVNQLTEPFSHGHSNFNGHQQGNPAGPHDSFHSQSSANQPTWPLNHGHSKSNNHQQGNPAWPHDPVHSHSSLNQPPVPHNHGHSNFNGHQQGNLAEPHDPVHSHSSVNQPTGPLNHGHSNSNSHQQGNPSGPLDPGHSHSSVNQPHWQLDHTSESQHGIQAGQAEHFRLPDHQVYLDTSRQMHVQIAMRNEINSQLNNDIQDLILREMQGHSPSNTNFNMGTHVSDQHPTHPRPQRSIETTMDGFIGRYDSLTRMKRAASNIINKSVPNSGTSKAGSGNVGTFQSSHQQTENGKSGDHVSNPNRELYTPLINDVPLTWPQDFKIFHVEQPGGTSQLIIEAGKGNMKKKYTVSAHSKRLNPTKTLPQLKPLKNLQRLTSNLKPTTTQTPNVTTEEPAEYEAI